MDEPILLASAGILLTAAALYARAGDRTASRGGDPRERLERAAFTLWWTGLAVAFGMQGFSALLLAFGIASVSFQTFVVHATILALCGAQAGLTHALVYLLTGSRRLALLMFAYYGGGAIALTTLTSTMRPIGVAAAGWGARLTYEHVHVLAQPLLVLVFGPPILLSVATLLASREVPDTAARRRLVGISLSVLLLTVAALVVEYNGGAGRAWSGLALAGALASSLILAWTTEGGVPRAPGATDLSRAPQDDA